MTQQAKTLEQLSGRLVSMEAALTLILIDQDVPRQVTRERLTRVRENLAAAQAALRELREVK